MNQFLKTKREITAWLDRLNVKNYTLTPDEQYGFVVDVAGDVNISNRQLNFIGVKFNHIEGSFNCSANSLTSLYGSPQQTKSYFGCWQNQLTSLEFAPQSVGGNFCCQENHLIDLTYCPHQVKGSFYCDENPLLGNAQTIENFKAIHKIHLQALAIQKEKLILDQNIGVQNVKSSSYLHKI